MANPTNQKSDQGPGNVHYVFYYNDGQEDNLIGVLKERRKNKKRVTEESIKKWGRLAAGSHVDPNSIFYITVNL
jgi:hypothetical protein